MIKFVIKLNKSEDDIRKMLNEAYGDDVPKKRKDLKQ